MNATWPHARRLVVVAPPIEGESLLSLLVRHCELNVLQRPADLLDEIGICRAAPEFLPFSTHEAAPAIAHALGLPLKEITSRMHAASDVGRTRGRVDFYGEHIERRFLEAGRRRVSPSSLRRSPHYRVAWMLRPLAFCPEAIERLIDTCPRCGLSLGWGRCSAVWQCEHCKFDLRDAEASSVAPEHQEVVGSAALLLSHDSAERARAVERLPEPFNSWTPAEAFSAIVEFGLAATTETGAVAKANQRVGAGDFRAFSVRELAAGVNFMAGWPDSLAALARSQFGRQQKTSLRNCLGTLGKYFASTSPPSLLRDLVRRSASSALHEARIPARLLPGTLQEGVQRVTTINALSVEQRFGITRERLRRLEGVSETFVARHAGNGGPALYSVDGITRLSLEIERTLDSKGLSQVMDLPEHVLPGFIQTGLLARSKLADLEVIYPEPRVLRSSVEALLESISDLPIEINPLGVSLHSGLRRSFNPNAWAYVIRAALGGELPATRTPHLASGPLSTIRVDRELLDAQLLVVDEAAPIDSAAFVSCRALARLFEVPHPFVAAAVAEGWIVGDRSKRNSQVSLASAAEFHGRYMLSNEVAYHLRCPIGRVFDELAAKGIRPVHNLYRHYLWARDECQVAFEHW